VVFGIGVHKYKQEIGEKRGGRGSEQRRRGRNRDEPKTSTLQNEPDFSSLNENLDDTRGKKEET